MLERLFGIAAHGSSVRTEVVAGCTTFLTMAYITFVNPAILSDAGMDFGAVFVATCLAAAIGTAIMALAANYPIALAPGMGLNAYFAYGVVLGLGYTWQSALGAVFLSGLLFLVLSLLPVREWLINAIPHTLKLAISAGIGLFLAIIALKNAGVVVDHPATLVTIGDVASPPVLLALAGFVLIVTMTRRGIPGAVIIGILAVTAVGVLLGVSEWKGLASLPPDPSPVMFQLDIAGALEAGLITIVFTFLLVDLFDTAGTLVGVSHRAGLLDERGRLPRLKRALPVLRTARADGACLRHGTGAAVRRLPDGARPGRAGLGRRHRVRTRRGHGHLHAAHLLHRARHRPRLHHLRAGEAALRPRERVPAGGVRGGRPVRPQVRAAVSAEVRRMPLLKRLARRVRAPHLCPHAPPQRTGAFRRSDSERLVYALSGTCRSGTPDATQEPGMLASLRQRVLPATLVGSSSSSTAFGAPAGAPFFRPPDSARRAPAGDAA